MDQRVVYQCSANYDMGIMYVSTCREISRNDIFARTCSRDSTSHEDIV